MSFLELQTNYYPGFDQPLDDGLIRRILVYSHVVKFINKDKYDKLSEKDKEKYAVGREDVRNKLRSNLDYMDVLGFYMLNVFKNYEHRELSYIPQIILDNTR